MQIAILGGTGDIGEGLALRWGRDTDHEVLIGSREEARGTAAAENYRSSLRDRGYEAHIEGRENREAAAAGEVIVLSVPPYYISDAIEDIAPAISDSILVSPAVGLEKDGTGFHYDPPPAGSVTALAARGAPDGVSVVGTFHNLPARRLADLSDPLGLDTLLLADDPDARDTVMGLVDEIAGLRPVSAGKIANAPEAEGLVPLLLNVAEYTGMEDVGVEFK